jgi:hypothetical protein
MIALSFYVWVKQLIADFIVGGYQVFIAGRAV